MGTAFDCDRTNRFTQRNGAESLNKNVVFNIFDVHFPRLNGLQPLKQNNEMCFYVTKHGDDKTER